MVLYQDIMRHDWWLSCLIEIGVLVGKTYQEFLTYVVDENFELAVTGPFPSRILVRQTTKYLLSTKSRKQRIASHRLNKHKYPPSTPY
jgi:hypothetical protein